MENKANLGSNNPEDQSKTGAVQYKNKSKIKNPMKIEPIHYDPIVNRKSDLE